MAHEEGSGEQNRLFQSGKDFRASRRRRCFCVWLIQGVKRILVVVIAVAEGRVVVVSEVKERMKRKRKRERARERARRDNNIITTAKVGQISVHNWVQYSSRTEKKDFYFSFFYFAEKNESMAS